VKHEHTLICLLYAFPSRSNEVIDGPADAVIVPLGIDTLNARAAGGDQDAVAVRVAVVSAALNAEERGGRANAVVGVAAGHTIEHADPAGIFGEKEAAKPASFDKHVGQHSRVACRVAVDENFVAAIATEEAVGQAHAVAALARRPLKGNAMRGVAIGRTFHCPSECAWFEMVGCCAFSRLAVRRWRRKAFAGITGALYTNLVVVQGGPILV